MPRNKMLIFVAYSSFRYLSQFKTTKIDFFSPRNKGTSILFFYCWYKIAFFKLLMLQLIQKYACLSKNMMIKEYSLSHKFFPSFNLIRKAQS